MKDIPYRLRNTASKRSGRLMLEGIEFNFFEFDEAIMNATTPAEEEKTANGASAQAS